MCTAPALTQRCLPRCCKHPNGVCVCVWQHALIICTRGQGGQAASGPRDTALGLALPGLMDALPQAHARARSVSSGAAAGAPDQAPRRLSASLDEGLGVRCA